MLIIVRIVDNAGLVGELFTNVNHRRPNYSAGMNKGTACGRDFRIREEMRKFAAELKSQHDT